MPSLCRHLASITCHFIIAAKGREVKSYTRCQGAGNKPDPPAVALPLGCFDSLLNMPYNSVMNLFCFEVFTTEELQVEELNDSVQK